MKETPIAHSIRGYIIQANNACDNTLPFLLSSSSPNQIEELIKALNEPLDNGIPNTDFNILTGIYKQGNSFMFEFSNSILTGGQTVQMEHLPLETKLTIIEQLERL